MSSSELLARRAVACKGWRWMPGMLHRNWRNSTRVTEEHAGYRWDGWPDLSDPLTVQALLLLVREAVEPNRAPGEWPMVCTHQSQGKKWGVGAWLNESERATFAALVLPAYDTEAAALVAALEAV